MSDPTQWASLALLIGIAADKFLARCNMYDGVKTMHFGLSKCCEFDVLRNTPVATPTALSATPSATQLQPPAPQPPPNLLEGLIEATRRLSESTSPFECPPTKPDVSHAAPTVQKIAGSS